MGLAFGIRKEPGTGLSNKKIAEQCIGVDHESPIIVQEEVQLAMKKFCGSYERLNIKSIPGNVPGCDSYSDTYNVAKEVEQIIENEGWSRNIILICHHAHYFRAKLVFKKLDIEVEPGKFIENIPFDKESTQWWTRAWWQWWIREIIAILVYKIKGKI